MKSRMQKGFTLIELLIVVAIIAILAAIAIPNFLAAQTRAKISRAKSELRTLATALESYYVDNTAYPDDADPTGWPWYLPSVVSTPIAYISSGLISDPFRLSIPSAIPGTPGVRYRYVNYDAELKGHFTMLTNGNTVESWLGHPGDTANVQAGIRKYGVWRLTSAGPDRNASPFGSDFFNDIRVYDPTNGTISNGDIIRGANGEVTLE